MINKKNFIHRFLIIINLKKSFLKKKRFAKFSLMEKSLSRISNALEKKSVFHFSKAYPFGTKTQRSYRQ